MKILYHTSHPSIHQLLIASIEDQMNIETNEQWGEGFVLKKDIDVVLVYCPMFFHKYYLSSEIIWKDFLKVKMQEVKLIFVGFRERGVAKNYIDLLNLPSDWEMFFSTAKQAKENWEPLLSGGLDAQSQLRKFYLGHTDESITDLIGAIKRKLVILQNNLVEGDSYEESIATLNITTVLPQQWKDLLYRWGRYRYLFDSLPFVAEFNRVDELMKSVDPYFQQYCTSEQLFKDLLCVEVLTEIKEILESYRRYGG